MIRDSINETILNIIRDTGFDSSFNPLVYNPIAWWDATDASTITESSNEVSQWDDKSGNGNDLVQLTGSQQPTYTASPPNIEFDADDNLAVTLAGGAVTGDVVAATLKMVLRYKITNDGSFTMRSNLGDKDVCQFVIYDDVITTQQYNYLVNYFVNQGCSHTWTNNTTISYAFSGNTYVTKIYTDDWDTRNVTNMNYTFNGCTNLVDLDVSNFDTGKVSIFGYTFNNCSSLTSLDVSNWDTSSANDMENMFYNCNSLTTLDVSNWDTSSVQCFRTCFYDCTTLTTLDVSNWDTSSVDDLFGCFSRCRNVTALDVSGWDTSSVTNCSFTFNLCQDITTLDLSNWNTSNVTDFSLFCAACTSLTTVTLTGGTGNPFADSACTNYTDAFTNTTLNQASIDAILVAINSAGTSSGTFDQSGGSAPSATGEAAIDALRARSWTVTVTGGY